MKTFNIASNTLTPHQPAHFYYYVCATLCFFNMYLFWSPVPHLLHCYTLFQLQRFLKLNCTWCLTNLVQTQVDLLLKLYLSISLSNLAQVRSATLPRKALQQLLLYVKNQSHNPKVLLNFLKVQKLLLTTQRVSQSLNQSLKKIPNLYNQNSKTNQNQNHNRSQD